VYAIPETPGGVANLWFMLEGHDILTTFVTDDRKNGLVNSIVNKSDTEEMRFLADRFDTIMAERVSGDVLTIDPAVLTDEGRGAPGCDARESAACSCVACRLLRQDRAFSERDLWRLTAGVAALRIRGHGPGVG
jgi:hypothetical protein